MRQSLTHIDTPQPGGWRQRLRLWWARQPAQRQDRLAMLTPLAAVLLFVAVLVAAIGYLHSEEVAREREALSRDVEYVHQRLRQRLLDQQEQLSRLARELASRELKAAEFIDRSDAFLGLYPEVLRLRTFDEQLRLRLGHTAASLPAQVLWSDSDPLTQRQLRESSLLAREVMLPIYTPVQRPANAQPKEAVVQLVLPLIDKARDHGVLVVDYSVDALFRYGVPGEITSRYAVSLRDASGQLLAGSEIPQRRLARAALPWSNAINADALEVSPIGNGLSVRAQAYRTSPALVGSSLFWLVSVLAAITAWLLLANWRHTRRRMRTQAALVQETAFRRAMEDSMLTGMRALDLKGRITYVNPAFCRMTGWGEAELVGQTAPFPYWPDAEVGRLHERLADELAGRIEPAGIQFRVKRKDGSLMDARLYVSPLIDAFGEQTGWMTSMTDITEPNRVREQLAAAHQRFTTVLEALDAAISVTPLDAPELLFANKAYRQWFGNLADGHLHLVKEIGLIPPASSHDDDDAVDGLAGLPADQWAERDAENAEIYLGDLGRWLEVRVRYLGWVDGRRARMLIATDITARRDAEEIEQIQVERAHTSSRLITMGEMASSVAHELNQPLTAINNYCNGMISRLKAHRIDADDLLSALEKTAHQAHRAGQIIQRIRAFVRRSEPNRTAVSVSTLLSEAVELAEIELRRRNVKLLQEVEAGLPPLVVDPILIEQVLLNLLKNAAEAIDHAQRPSGQRRVRLQVRREALDDKPALRFEIEDTGHGIAPDVMNRLYETFYSTKTDGMGIGLSLCRSIIESHLGRIKAENLYYDSAIVGCRFTLWIPCDAQAAVPSPSPLNR